MALEQVFRLMKVLTTQGTGTLGGMPGPEATVLARLSECVTKVLKEIDSQEMCSRWKETAEQHLRLCSRGTTHQMVELCLFLLRQLKEELMLAASQFKAEVTATKVLSEHHAPKLPPDVLSIEQNATVVTVMQFVLALGVLPNLEPGLGAVLDERTRHSAVMRDIARPSAKVFRRSVDVLLDVAQHPALNSLLFSRYLAYLLTAVIQLAKGKNIAQVRGDSEDADPSYGSEAERRHYHLRMNMIMKSVYKPLLVREIFLLLQRVNKISSQSPHWLGRVCGEVLTGVLQGIDGVRNIVSGIMFDGDQSWQQCEAAGRVIATCPSSTKVDDYYKLIAPQVVGLLCSQDIVVAGAYCNVACSVINAMAIRHPAEMKKYVWSLLVEPFRECTESGLLQQSLRDMKLSEGCHGGGLVCVPVPAIENCIGNLFKVFCGGGGDPHTELCSCMVKVVPWLLEVLSAAAHTSWTVRSQCEQLLHKYLKMLGGHDTSKDVFESLVLFVSKSPLESSGAFSVNADGHLCLTTGDLMTGPSSRSVDDDNICMGADGPLNFVGRRAACLVRVFQGCHDDSLSAEFFLFLLQKLNAILALESDGVPDSAGFDQSTQGAASLPYNLAVLRLLAESYETLGASVCLTKTAYVLSFAQLTLERWIRLLQTEGSSECNLFELDTLTLAVGLILATFTDEDVLHKVTEQEWAIAGDLLLLLEKLEQLVACSQSMPMVSEMAFAARTAIATRGHVSNAGLADWTKAARGRHLHDDRKGRSMPAASAAQRPAVGIPETPQVHARMPVSGPPSTGALSDAGQDATASVPRKGTSGNATTTSSFPTLVGESVQSALDCLAAEDSLLPLRAHALIVLRHHVENRSREAVARSQELLAVCEQHMNDPDSYVYLASINCMAALADKFAESILPAIASKFSNPPTSYSILDRLKVGEALVKAVKVMGDMAPKYRDIILPAVLTGVRSEDELVRASSLANLSEACRLLRYSLMGYVHEIVHCARSVALSDQSAMARQAAVSVIALLLRGIKETSTGHVLDAVESILGVDALRSIYRDLRRIKQQDSDAGVQQQVDIACSEVDAIVSAALSLSPELTKRIWVLEAPP